MFRQKLEISDRQLQVSDGRDYECSKFFNLFLNCPKNVGFYLYILHFLAQMLGQEESFPTTFRQLSYYPKCTGESNFPAPRGAPLVPLCNCPTTQGRISYLYTWWIKKWGRNFVEGEYKIAITRSAVLTQNAPQTVWRPGSVRIRGKREKIEKNLIVDLGDGSHSPKVLASKKQYKPPPKLSVDYAIATDESAGGRFDARVDRVGAGY